MMICRYWAVSSLLLILVTPLPAPQTEDLSEDYYGDYDAEAANDTPEQGSLEEILRLGAGLAEGFLTLLGEKVKIINGLLSDKDLRSQVGNTVSAGLNFTGQVARAAAPVVQSAVKSVPVILNTGRQVLEDINSEEHQQRTRQALQGVSE